MTADLNSDESLVLLTLESGKVELRRDTGYLIRVICDRDAVNARFSGKDLVIEMKNGTIALRKESGALIRKI